MIVREISSEDALDLKEEHSTTKVYFDTEKEFEEVAKSFMDIYPKVEE